MRSVLSTLIVLSIFALGTVVVSAESAYDFRNLEWGLSEEIVKEREAEKTLVFLEEGLLIYRINLAKLESFITHYFDSNDHLTLSVVDFRTEYADQDRHIADFYYLKDLLEKKYGRPESFIDYEWRNDCITNAEEKAHFILLGKLSYSQTWLREKTIIRLTLDKEQDKIVLRLTYAERTAHGETINPQVSTHPWVNSVPPVKVTNKFERNSADIERDLGQI